ncbi:MAG: IS1182 family transposase, partial [Rhodospirillales bacterium]|nr:IS1182 family transposase [Rhodospirillales bacterium]
MGEADSARDGIKAAKLERRWAKPKLDRNQVCMASLDEWVPADHGIRLVDAVMRGLDWSAWENVFCEERRGQPPIHPRLMATAIFYGLLRKIRSSRELEEATRERLDFQWLFEGRAVDHSTFAAFRTMFGEQLKELNCQVVTAIGARHEKALQTLVVDGTRLRACSDRHGARTADTLDAYLARYVEMLNQRLERMESLDEQQAHDAQAAQEIEALRAEIFELSARIATFEKASQTAHARDAQRRKKLGKNADPVRVPVNDPDSSIVPNKEGGHAPNYTPTATVDAHTGAIVSAHVPEGADEASAVMGAVSDAERLGTTPQRVMADGGFSSGDNLKQLDDKGIDACMPTGTDFRPTNPANRSDIAQPVPEDQRDCLPMKGTGFHRNAFVYDPDNDCYRCPMGEALTRQGQGSRRNGISCVTYTCAACEHCPLAHRCLPKNQTARNITRDAYQDLRDEVGRYMATDQGNQLYRTRAHLIETVFARIKTHMGIRAFHLCGLDKVRIEWNWICGAYNLNLLVRVRQMATRVYPRAIPPVLPTLCTLLQAFTLPSQRAGGTTLRLMMTQRQSVFSNPIHIVRRSLEGGGAPRV